MPYNRALRFILVGNENIENSTNALIPYSF